MIKILKNPITLLTGIIFGFLIAFFAKGVVPILEPISTVYLSLLKMCVIPIVATAVAVNLQRLIRNKTGNIMGKWLIVVVIALLLSATLGTTVSMLCRTWVTPDSEVIHQLTKTEEDSDEFQFQVVSYYDDSREASQTEAEFSLIDFLTDTVPTNIFNALTANNMMQIIFFFVIFGSLLGILPATETEGIVKGLEGIYSMFCRFVGGILVFLPIGMCAMIAVQFKESNIQKLVPVVGKFILLQLGVMMLLILISFLVIQVRLKVSIKEHFEAMKRTFLVAIGTGSCIASISVAMEDSVEKLRLEPQATKAILPIGITTFQYGVIASGAIAAVYGTSIYPVTITFQALLIIVIGAIAFSFSIIGAPGVVAVSMLSIILTPLGIPSEVIILIFLATIPFFDPLAVFASVYANIAVSAIVAPGRKTNEVKK